MEIQPNPGEKTPVKSNKTSPSSSSIKCSPSTSTTSTASASRVLIITPEQIAKLGLTQQINKVVQSQVHVKLPSTPLKSETDLEVPRKRTVKVSKITIFNPNSSEDANKEPEELKSKETVTSDTSVKSEVANLMKNKLSNLLKAREKSFSQIPTSTLISSEMKNLEDGLYETKSETAAGIKRKRDYLEASSSKINETLDDEVVFVDTTLDLKVLHEVPSTKSKNEESQSAVKSENQAVSVIVKNENREQKLVGLNSDSFQTLSDNKDEKTDLSQARIPIKPIEKTASEIGVRRPKIKSVPNILNTKRGSVQSNSRSTSLAKENTISIQEHQYKEEPHEIPIQNIPQTCEDVKPKIHVLSNEQISLPHTYIESLKFKPDKSCISHSAPLFIYKASNANSSNISDVKPEIVEEETKIHIKTELPDSKPSNSTMVPETHAINQENYCKPSVSVEEGSVKSEFPKTDTEIASVSKSAPLRPKETKSITIIDALDKHFIDEDTIVVIDDSHISKVLSDVENEEFAANANSTNLENLTTKSESDIKPNLQVIDLTENVDDEELQKKTVQKEDIGNHTIVIQESSQNYPLMKSGMIKNFAAKIKTKLHITELKVGNVKKTYSRKSNLSTNLTINEHSKQDSESSSEKSKTRDKIPEPKSQILHSVKMEVPVKNNPPKKPYIKKRILFTNLVVKKRSKENSEISTTEISKNLDKESRPKPEISRLSKVKVPSKAEASVISSDETNNREVQNNSITDQETNEIIKPAPKKRGRKKKSEMVKTETVEVQNNLPEPEVETSRRGRKRKVVDYFALSEGTDFDTPEDSTNVVKKPRRSTGLSFSERTNQKDGIVEIDTIVSCNSNDNSISCTYSAQEISPLPKETPKRKRGRPPRIKVVDNIETVQEKTEVGTPIHIKKTSEITSANSEEIDENSLKDKTNRDNISVSIEKTNEAREKINEIIPTDKEKTREIGSTGEKTNKLYSKNLKKSVEVASVNIKETSEHPTDSEKTNAATPTDTEKTSEIGSTDIEKTNKLPSKNVKKSVEVASVDIKETSEHPTDSEKTNAATPTDTEKTSEIGSTDIEKTNKLPSKNVKKSVEVASVNVKETSEHPTDSEKTNAATPTDTEKTSEIGSTHIEKTNKLPSKNVKKSVEVASVDIKETSEHPTDSEKTNAATPTDTEKTSEIGSTDIEKTNKLPSKNVKKSVEVASVNIKETSEHPTDSEKTNAATPTDTEKASEIGSTDIEKTNKLPSKNVKKSVEVVSVDIKETSEHPTNSEKTNAATPTDTEKASEIGSTDIEKTNKLPSKNVKKSVEVVSVDIKETSEHPTNSEKTNAATPTDTEKTSEIGSIDIEKTNKFPSKNVKKSVKVASVDIKETSEHPTDSEKTNAATPTDTEKTSEIGSTDIEKTNKLPSKNVKKSVEVASVNIKETSEHSTNSEKTNAATPTDTEKTSEIGSTDVEKTNEVSSSDTSNSNTSTNEAAEIPVEQKEGISLSSKKKRGRPKRVTSEIPAEQNEEPNVSKKRKGRPQRAEPSLTTQVFNTLFQHINRSDQDETLNETNVENTEIAGNISTIETVFVKTEFKDTSSVPQPEKKQSTKKTKKKGRKRKKAKSKSFRVEKPSTVSNDGPTVTCAVCNKELTRISWANHKLRFHNNLAWKVGDPPLDLNDQKFVMSVLSDIYKRRKPLYCEKCGESKKSVLGYLSHKSMCQKSTEEITAMRVKCEFCDRSVLPVSMSVHLKFCKANEPEHNSSWEGNNSQAKPDDFPVQGKREAAKKAHNLIKSLKNDGIIETAEGKSKKSLRWHLDFDFRPTYFGKKRFRIELIRNGIAKCRFEECIFETSDVDELSNHLYACDKKPTEGYTCKFCIYTFRTENEILDHLREAHTSSLNPNDTPYEGYSEGEDLDEDELVDDCDDNGDKIPTKHTVATNKRVNLLHGIKFLLKHRYCSPNTNIAYPPALEWTLKFCKQNFSVPNLFPNWRTTLVNWEKLHPTLIANYLPHLKYSACTTCIENKNFVDPLELNHEWKRYKLFEANLSDNGSSMIFCGGPIFAMAWAPTPYDQTNCAQILAVSANCDINRDYTLDKKYSESGLIQFWNCGPLLSGAFATEPPKLEFCIAHDYGPIWHLEWCPSGCYDVEPNQEHDLLQRVGILAIGSGDSHIYLYSVCSPGQISGKILKTKPILKLVLDSVLEHTASDLEPHVTKIAWSKVSEHRYLLAGYANGMVAIYDLNTTSTLLRLGMDQNGIQTIMPYRVFNAHHHAITVLCLYHLNDGRRWILTGSIDRTIKYWDLENPVVPLTTFTRFIVTDGVWLNHWLSTIHSFDDSCSGVLTYTAAHQLRNFESESASIMHSNSRVMSITGSDWINGFVQGNVVGELKGFFPHQMFYSMDGDKSYRNKKVILGYTRLVEKSLSINERTEEEKQRLEKMNSKPKQTDSENSIEMTTDFSKPEPVTYKQADEKYGLAFCDMTLGSVKDFIPNISSYYTSNKPDKLYPARPNIYPMQSITKVAFNPNQESYLYLATGYQAGFVRISNLRFLNRNRKNN